MSSSDKVAVWLLNTGVDLDLADAFELKFNLGVIDYLFPEDVKKRASKLSSDFLGQFRVYDDCGDSLATEDDFNFYDLPCDISGSKGDEPYIVAIKNCKALADAMGYRFEIVFDGFDLRTILNTGTTTVPLDCVFLFEDKWSTPLAEKFHKAYNDMLFNSNLDAFKDTPPAWLIDYYKVAESELRRQKVLDLFLSSILNGTIPIEKFSKLLSILYYHNVLCMLLPQDCVDCIKVPDWIKNGSPEYNGCRGANNENGWYTNKEVVSELADIIMQRRGYSLYNPEFMVDTGVERDYNILENNQITFTGGFLDETHKTDKIAMPEGTDNIDKEIPNNSLGLTSDDIKELIGSGKLQVEWGSDTSVDQSIPNHYANPPEPVKRKTTRIPTGSIELVPFAISAISINNETVLYANRWNIKSSDGELLKSFCKSLQNAGLFKFTAQNFKKSEDMFIACAVGSCDFSWLTRLIKGITALRNKGLSISVNLNQGLMISFAEERLPITLQLNGSDVLESKSFVERAVKTYIKCISLTFAKYEATACLTNKVQTYDNLLPVKIKSEGFVTNLDSIKFKTK